MKRVLVFIFLISSPGLFGQDRPSILLSNDDGIEAPGLVAMYDALREIGEVTVAAPAENQSATGHGLTTGNTPIFVTSRVDEYGSSWHTITARPATCVRLALENLLSRPPDIVVSGGNRGANLGLVTYLSGTVGAAREAAFQGIPAIAVSVESGSFRDFQDAGRFTARLVLQYPEKGLPPKTFLNVNYPAGSGGTVPEARIARLSLETPINFFTAAVAPSGQRLYWPGYRDVAAAEPDSDVTLLSQGYITITPMQLDQTDADLLDVLQAWALTLETASH